MKLAASQPTFLSYPGYFGLIDYVDYFVVMDKVSFSPRSWQQRVLIRNNSQSQFLSVPVKKKKLRGQFIMDVEIDETSNYIRKHLKTIKNSYSKFPFFDRYYPDLEKVYLKNYNKLIDLNVEFIKYILSILKIDLKKIVYLSDLNINEIYVKDDLIFQICRSFTNIDTYVSTYGAENYLRKNLKLYKSFSVKFFSFNFDEDEFFFYNENYCHLSVIDLLFKHGEKTLDIIRSRFKII